MTLNLAELILNIYIHTCICVYISHIWIILKLFFYVDPLFSQPNCSWKKYDKVNRLKQVTDLELIISDLLKMTRLPFYDNKCGSTIWKWAESQTGRGSPVNCEIGCQKYNFKIWFNHQKLKRKRKKPIQLESLGLPSAGQNQLSLPEGEAGISQI